MIALIAEKPSVAKDIARIVGANQRCDGYLAGNNFMVTWAFGHLIQLAMPDAYGVENFKREHLPILPLQFRLIPRQVKGDKGYKSDPGVMKQLKIIREVFDKCDKIVVATDAGREGELIFRYIYNYLNCKKPFERLWISSLTDKAIREGMKNLHPGRKYDNLFLSARSRSEADWLIGINATQALTVAAGQGIFSLGRVQTPTLKMICNRYWENKNFVPTKFWQIKATTQSDGHSFSAMSVLKWALQPDASNAMERIRQEGKLTVKSVENKEKKQEPPFLYDLTSLQKEANTKLNFSADKTLSIAQSLYEKKVMSYPRTGSRYISEDVFEEIPERIALLQRYSRYSDYARNMKGRPLNRRSVNDSKVTDHHALIITEVLPENLSKDETAIYEMVAGRLLEAFSSVCVKDITSFLLCAADTEFKVTGSVIKIPGWRGVFNEINDDGDDEGVSLPELHEGDILPLNEIELLEKQTKPKPLHTESSLLAAMENAGKELEDTELRESMKECGIGTPATRAAIIETLFARQYIIREKKNLVPTEKGLKVYEIVKDKKISDVEMTGNWETALSKIESGNLSMDYFSDEIKEYTTRITRELLSVSISVKDNSNSSCGLICPKCKSGSIRLFPKVAKCTDDKCGFIVFRNKCEKQLSDKQISDLITKRKTSLIKGFKSKAGKTFDASLVLDDQFNISFSFPDKSTTNRILKK